jgi:hypothetical protein
VRVGLDLRLPAGYGQRQTPDNGDARFGNLDGRLQHLGQRQAAEHLVRRAHSGYGPRHGDGKVALLSLAAHRLWVAIIVPLGRPVDLEHVLMRFFGRTHVMVDGDKLLPLAQVDGQAPIAADAARRRFHDKAGESGRHQRVDGVAPFL